MQVRFRSFRIARLLAMSWNSSLRQSRLPLVLTPLAALVPMA